MFDSSVQVLFTICVHYVCYIVLFAKFFFHFVTVPQVGQIHLIE